MEAVFYEVQYCGKVHINMTEIQKTKNMAVQDPILAVLNCTSGTLRRGPRK